MPESLTHLRLYVGAQGGAATAGARFDSQPVLAQLFEPIGQPQDIQYGLVVVAGADEGGCRVPAGQFLGFGVKDGPQAAQQRDLGGHYAAHQQFLDLVSHQLGERVSVLGIEQHGLLGCLLGPDARRGEASGAATAMASAAVSAVSR